MKVLVDTNVILDVLLERRSHAEASAVVWGMLEKGAGRGLVSAHAVPTLYYLIRKEHASQKAKRILSALLTVFDVAPVDQAVIEHAFDLPMSDFEDAVTAASARNAGCDLIVTRDSKGFRGSPVRALAPEAAAAALGSD